MTWRSLYTRSYSMTGEVSLRGLVLPIGGLKEKLIAAHQNGIQRVLIPHRSEIHPPAPCFLSAEA